MPVFSLCRICLTEDTDEDAMQPLFDEKNKRCVEIVKQIEECGGIVLKPHEEFPKMICYRCLDSLNTSYKFRSLCQASEHALLDAIVKSEMKAEPNDGSGITETLRSESKNNIFYELRTEFIAAEEVELSEIADNKTVEYIEDIEDIEESSHDFDLGSGSERQSDANEFVDIDYTDDSDEDYKISTKKFTKKNVKRRTPAKINTKSVGTGKRGRPRQNAAATIKKEKPVKSNILTPDHGVKPGRGRKKNTEETSSIMCEICGNIYSKQSLLNMHMRRHLSYKPFECEICSKTFACPSEIRRHMRVHTGEKPYVCKFCGRTFADRSTNIKHERIHTNERPFTCQTCGKSFTYSNVLKNHMLTHTGEKPFPCLACNKTFSRKHQLNQHCGTLTHQQTVKNLTNLNSNTDLKIDELLQVNTAMEH